MKLVAGTRRTLSTELSRLETKSYLSYATTHLRSMSYFDIFHYYYSPAQARGSLWPEVGIVFARIQLWRCGHYSPLNNSWLNCTQAASNKKEKEVKRQTLLELVDYVNTSAGQKIFTEASMPVCSHVLMPVDTPPVSRQLWIAFAQTYAARCHHKPKIMIQKKTNLYLSHRGPTFK